MRVEARGVVVCFFSARLRRREVGVKGGIVVGG